MTGSPVAVETVGLAKSYGARRAVRGLDLDVSKGEVFGLIGPNGAGKTTTLRMLLDLVRPSSGTVRVLGQEPRTGGAALRRRIGYLPGELRLEQRASGRDLLAYYARLSGGRANCAAVLARGVALAERLGLELDRRVGALSKGNKQKLGLVQAFMHDPELLVLDEPTSGLDPLVQQEFLQLVREARDAGRTVFLSSHVLSEVEAVAGRVALLRSGRLQRLASVRELRAAAPRRLRVSLVAPTDTDLERLKGLPGLEGARIDRAGSLVTLTAQLVGEPAALIRALSALPLSDLVLEEPDLEEAVLALYGTEEDG